MLMAGTVGKDLWWMKMDERVGTALCLFQLPPFIWFGP